MPGVTTYIIALRKQALEFVRFCHAHACDLVELPNGDDEDGTTGEGRVHAFCVVDRDFDTTILPEAIFGRWPYPFDSAETLRDLLEDLVEEQLGRGREVSILLVASSPDEVRKTPVLHGLLALLDDRPKLQRQVWLAAALTCSPQVDVSEDLFRRAANSEGLLDAIFFLAPARQRGAAGFSELHWPGLRMLIDIARDDGDARKYFLDRTSAGPFWVPPDRVICGPKRRPEELATFLNRAVHAMKVFDRGRSERENEELKRFNDRLDEFERQLQEFEISPAEEKSLDLGRVHRPQSFLLEHVHKAFESFATRVWQVMEKFREKHLHRDFIERSLEVETRRKKIRNRYFIREPLTMPFADMPVDKETDNQLRAREKRLRQQAEELQDRARELRMQASLDMGEPQAEDMQDRMRKLQLSKEYRGLALALQDAQEKARRIFPVFTAERVIGILGLVLVLSVVLVHNSNTSLVSLGEEGMALLEGLGTHFGSWSVLPLTLALFLLLASLAWGTWRRLYGERSAFSRLAGILEKQAGAMETAFQKLSETAAAYLFHSGGALMARHMYERLHAQRTGNIFRLLERQARRLWRTPSQNEVEEQARNRNIVEAFTLSLQQAAFWECQGDGGGRQGLAVSHRRMRIARNAMFHLMRQWLVHHEANSWQISINGETNTAIVRERREASRGAPFNIAGTYGLQDARREPCQGLIVPLEPARTRTEDDKGAKPEQTLLTERRESGAPPDLETDRQSRQDREPLTGADKTNGEAIASGQEGAA